MESMRRKGILTGITRAHQPNSNPCPNRAADSRACLLTNRHVGPCVYRGMDQPPVRSYPIRRIGR
jgi:hypothetical protein